MFWRITLMFETTLLTENVAGEVDASAILSSVHENPLPLSNIPIKESEWNRYLSKYDSKFKTYRDEDGISVIQCKYGKIAPFSSFLGLLGFYGCFPTSNKKTRFLAKIPPFCEVIQDGDTDVGLKFPESKLWELVGCLRIKKRRVISPEEKKRLQEQMRKFYGKEGQVASIEESPHNETEVKHHNGAEHGSIS